MKRGSDGCWRASRKLTGRPGQLFQWGVRGPQGWMLFEEEPLAFRLDEASGQQQYQVSGLTSLGLCWHGRALEVRLWAPHAQAVELFFEGPRQNRFGLERQGEFWFARLADGRVFEGCAYGFELVTAEGDRVVRSDPYARSFQGPQRGVCEVYLEKPSGRVVHRYAKVPMERFLRFEAVSSTGPVWLSFHHHHGRALSASQLRERLSGRGRALAARAQEAFWRDRVGADGRIELAGKGPTWSVLVPRPETLVGLEYALVDAEGRAHHDRWRTELRDLHLWPALGLVPPREEFRWCHPKPSFGPEEMVVYQLHIGSWRGAFGNRRSSHLGDLLEHLDYFEQLGVNAIELLPTNTFEGHRDWGYTGTASLGVSQNYGYFDEHGWVDGALALKRFIDAAHGRGIKVLNDVVYNHIGGDHNNLWEFDGKRNSWFEWEHQVEPDPALSKPLPRFPSATAEARSQNRRDTTRHTPWGPIPAYSKKAVAQFFIDHALGQLHEFGFDGIRFDFTHLIHNRSGGGSAGWSMLRRMHRTVRRFFPEALTYAEEFPQHPIIATPAGGHGEGGAGFDGMWNTEFQHRLVYDHHRPSVLQQAATGQPMSLERFVDHLTEPEGFSDYLQSITVLSNHDEVGNAKRIIGVASQGHGSDSRSLALARVVCGLGLLAPGIPIFFQGTENLASNYFSWGLPHSWDLGWDWWERRRGPRWRHFVYFQAMLGLRRQRSDLRARVPAQPLWVDGSRGVLALRRGHCLLLVNLGSKKAEVSIDGSWDLLLSSEERRFGGRGRLAHRATRQFELGPATLAVYSRVPST
ncbi:MAG: alpha-amylase family glycosyl hydrolase [Vulcanimicrobiota bacterium]